MNPGQVTNETNLAESTGQNLQNQYNQQASQQYGQYQGAQGQANSAYGNLKSYNDSMANPEDLYNQALSSAQSMYGFDPKQLLVANQNLARTNTTMANLPQAIQQQGNYYGTTAGSEAQNYSNQAGNLQNVLAGQSNTANAFGNVLSATQNQANQAAQLGLQGEQLKSQNYAQMYSTAVSQMQSAGQTLAQLENLQQQQGTLTAGQVAAYRNAYSTYVTAQANAAQAYANANQTNQQTAMSQQLADYFSQAAGGDKQKWASLILSALQGKNVDLKSILNSGTASTSSTAPAKSSSPAPAGNANNFVSNFFNNPGAAGQQASNFLGNTVNQAGSMLGGLYNNGVNRLVNNFGNFGQ